MNPSQSFLILLSIALSATIQAEDITRGPYLQQGSHDGIIIRWRTEAPTIGKVWYDKKATSLNNHAAETVATHYHEIKLENLAPKTRYHYAIGSENQSKPNADKDSFFMTSPRPGKAKPTRIWVIGDSGTANDDANAVYKAYRNYNGDRYTDLWLMLGDNAYTHGTDEQYQAAVFDTYPEILAQSPLWPTLGNHDAKSVDTANQSGVYYDLFTLPKNGEVGGTPSGTEAYYSFDYGNIHFLCLASISVDRSVGAEMYQWAKKDLENSKAKWLIAFFHHPTYTKGSHDSDKEVELIEMRENYLPLLEKHGADLVLSGHSHSYERSYLVDGHYGHSHSLDSKTHFLDGGDGRIDGDGAYVKATNGLGANEGSVNIVAGSSGKVSKMGGKVTLDHPVMYLSLLELGSLVVDVESNKMNVVFLNEKGESKDHFTIVKKH